MTDLVFGTALKQNEQTTSTVPADVTTTVTGHDHEQLYNLAQCSRK